MKHRSSLALISALLAVSVVASTGRAGPVRKKIAIEAGNVITITGADIQDGIILVEDGTITAVGKKVEIPWDAFVIDAKDRTVMPGFVLAHTSYGLDVANENVPTVPFLSTADSIDPMSRFFEDSLRDGVVAALVLPGDNTLLGGTGTIVSPHGRTVEDMLVKHYVGLKISLRPTRGSSRMSHMQRLRRYMEELEHYRSEYAARKKEAKEDKKPFDEEIDPKRQSAIDLVDGKLTAFIYCDVAADVPKALEIIETYKLKAVLVLSPDCYKAAALIAKAKLPVVLDPQLTVWETNEETNAEEMKVIPLIFNKAKIKFAFQSNMSQYGQRYLWYQAATAVKYGMKRAEALKSITLYPAKFIGVDDRFGSIAKGKEANLIFLTGDPLDAQTWVDKVMLGGRIVYEKDKDERLKKLLEKPQSEGSAEENTD